MDIEHVMLEQAGDGKLLLDILAHQFPPIDIFTEIEERCADAFSVQQMMRRSDRCGSIGPSHEAARQVRHSGIGMHETLDPRRAGQSDHDSLPQTFHRVFISIGPESAKRPSDVPMSKLRKGRPSGGKIDEPGYPEDGSGAVSIAAPPEVRI